MWFVKTVLVHPFRWDKVNRNVTSLKFAFTTQSIAMIFHMGVKVIIIYLHLPASLKDRFRLTEQLDIKRLEIAKPYRYNLSGILKF